MLPMSTTPTSSAPPKTGTSVRSTTSGYAAPFNRRPAKLTLSFFRESSTLAVSSTNHPTLDGMPYPTRPTIHELKWWKESIPRRARSTS